MTISVRKSSEEIDINVKYVDQKFASISTIWTVGIGSHKGDMKFPTASVFASYIMMSFTNIMTESEIRSINLNTI